MNATNTLTGEHVRNRPSRHNPAIYRRAAEILIERMDDYGIDLEDADPADVLRDVERVMRTHGGYDRARDLERAGWMPDRNMVEWLDDDTTWDAHSEAVRDWVKAEGIVAALPIGAMVMVSNPRHNGGALSEGSVYGINADEATYTIYVPAFGHVKEGNGTHGIILTFEEVESANPVNAGATKPEGSQGESAHSSSSFSPLTMGRRR